MDSRGFKPSNYQPFASKKQAPPKVKQYERPDPSKRQDCGENRPIKFNAKGKYNLNFIDYQNEFEAVCEAEEKIKAGETPIYGMDIAKFEAIRAEERAEIEAQFGVKEKFYEKFPVKEATENSTDKQCSICLKYYQIGCKVFFLPCYHHFHIECIMPWFKNNHVCPNCRFDLNADEAEAEEDNWAY